MRWRMLVVLSSVVLSGAFVWYRATEAPPAEVLPSSKVGTALEIYSGDFAAPSPLTLSTPDLYTVVCDGSKHAGPPISVRDARRLRYTCVTGLVERP